MITSGYGLRNIKTKELVGVYTQSNGNAECCGELAYKLSESESVSWIVKDKLTASYVRINSTPWYNAGYESPINLIDPNTLEVVKIELIITPEKADVIPTSEEYLELKFNTPGIKSYSPEYYKIFVEERKRRGKSDYCGYSVDELEELIECQNKCLKK